MLRTTLAGMRRRKLRMLLSGLAVVLGVMAVAGSIVLTGTLGRSIDRIFADAHAHTDVWVHGRPKIPAGEFAAEPPPVPIPADVRERVLAVPGVAEATGHIQVDGARVIGPDGKVVGSFGPPRLGVNWTGENELVQLRAGRGPEAADEIAVNAGLAQLAGLSVGDRVGVLTREPRRDVTVVGIFGYSGGRDWLGGVQEVAFTDEVAARLMLGQPQAWTAVSVRAAEGVDPERLRDAIAAELGDDYQVRTADELAAEQSAQLREALAVLTSMLLGFAAVALFVGMFLILNTFSILVAQRQRELALTRALGASRRQVLTAVLLEAAVTGLVAGALGVLAGIGVAAALAAVAARYAALPMAGLAVTVPAMLACLLVGVAVTMLAALPPALRASRVPPVAAMREAAAVDRPLTRLTVTGVAVLAAGVAALAAGLAGSALRLVLAGVLACLLATALLAPAVARPAVAVLGRLLSWSVPGRLGRLNAARNPRRTAVTASALMVGVALVTGASVVVRSFQDSVTDLLGSSLHAELVVTGEVSGERPPSFDADVLHAAAALDGVRAAVGLYLDPAVVDGETTFIVAATDLAALADVFGAEPLSGDLSAPAPDALLVSEQAADDRGLEPGDAVTVQLGRGDPHRLTVVAVYPDGTLPGRYLAGPRVTADLTVPDPYLGFVRLEPGAAAEPVRAQLSRWLADNPEVSVTDRSSFIAQQARQLDSLLTMVRALLGLAILVAVLGIVNTLALSVVERTRELGLLRAVGLGRSATMRMVTVEAVLLALFGALLGIVSGTGLGAAVVRAMADQGIRTLTLPWADLGAYLLLAAVAGVAAAVVPAVRAARMDVLGAVAYE
ncbi:MAG: FtsX-like permease family protein [Micromonosporaceae bacterium]|jgi:putative ABC transport system permease protein